MTIRRETRLLALPMCAPFSAAHDAGLVDTRELVVVRLSDIESGVDGWGECAALNQPGYTPEWARGAFEMLAGGASIDAQVSPMASAAIEMAALDLELRTAGTSLAGYLGATTTTVTAGAAIGLGTVEEVMARATTIIGAGFTRLKLKITPDGGFDHVAEVRAAFPDVEIQVDANGSFTANQLDLLCELNPLAIAVIEQPFAPDDIDALRSLRSRIGAWVLVDEGSRPSERLTPLIEADAIDGVVVKPSILGISGAVGIIERVAAHGLAVSVGGMVETALGRRVMAAFSARPDVTVVGDTSPSALWLDGDPWPDLAMLEGSVGVANAPGIAPPPDTDRLAAATVEFSEADG